MDKQIEELTKRIERLEKGTSTSKPKREKRVQSEKQKQNAEVFKKTMAKLKKENPDMPHKEVFSLVHKTIKEEKSKN